MNSTIEMIEQDEEYYPDYVLGFGTDEDEEEGDDDSE